MADPVVVAKGLRVVRQGRIARGWRQYSSVQVALERRDARMALVASQN